ncbi:Tigr01459 family had hydrolase, partial [Globisporangium splendens]
MSKIVRGLRDVAGKYDVFLIDQYGVLHNGSVAYPGAVECFNRLEALDKRVVLLSNTSKRAASLRGKLATFGFDPNFLGSVTGGEVAWTYLKAHSSELARCALMTVDAVESVGKRQTNTESLFHGLDVQVVDVESAQFLLVEGTRRVCYSEDPAEALHTDFHTTGQVNDHIRSFLENGRKRNLPMLCTNPDLVAMLKDNQMVHMGGKIAKMYEEMGGSVMYFGKPLKEHFEVCLDMANVAHNAADRARVIHIGDSFHHDIQGAVNTGIDSIFIAGGVHAPELGMSESSAAVEPEPLAQLCAKFGLVPTYTASGFVW